MTARVAATQVLSESALSADGLPAVTTRNEMIELIQFPWSPFCIVIRRILEFSGHPFRIRDIPSTDRTLVWRLTHERYYGVPIIRDGKNVIFEVSDDSQVIAKYIDEKLKLALFTWEWEGVQTLVWHHIENEVEGLAFRLNDIYWKDFVPQREQLAFLRHKERKFGRGCIDQWRDQRASLVKKLTETLMPYEEMLLRRPFLLDQQPRFVDFDLYGMLGNFLHSGNYRLPAAHNGLRDWYSRMTQIQFKANTREKELHSGHKRTPARPKLAAKI